MSEKNIEIVKPEKLNDESLEKASGGCLVTCTMQQVDSFGLGDQQGVMRSYKKLVCVDCGREKFMRRSDADGEPDNRWREISREEYYYVRNAHLG